jgi:hypothetical protein
VGVPQVDPGRHGRASGSGDSSQTGAFAAGGSRNDGPGISGLRPLAGSDRVPSSWLAPSIVATLCCFSPTGVVALYFAAQVSIRWSHGDRRSALRCARIARAWVLVSVVLWIVTMAILIGTGRAGRFLEAGVL